MINTYLVTGASGYIGKRLCEYFNYRKKRFIPSNRSGLNGISLDLSITDFPDSLFKDIDSIIHLAGLAHESTNSKDTKIYNKINGLSTVNLAEAASKNGVRKFVFISSVKAGENTVYGNSKLLAEEGLKKLATETDMIISIVRPSLVYSRKPTGNLKKLISAIKLGFFPPPPETNNKRSLIHLDDLCIAIDKILEKNDKSGSIFIVTDNKIYSTRTIYEYLNFSVGKQFPSWSVPFFLVEVAKKVFPSARKLFSDDEFDKTDLSQFGFVPKFTLRNINESLF